VLRLCALLSCAVAVWPAPVRGEGAKSYPARILLIRHAEKPDDPKEVGLSERGKQRAAALPKLFEKADDRAEPLPKPDYLFATRDSEASRRPTKTLKPLAKKLGLKVHAEVANKDFAALARKLLSDPKYAGKTVLICWHHGTMPELAVALDASQAPDRWKDKVFDRVWQIEYSRDGKATFRDRPQRLLEGDAKK
jgi:hypothetical protein